MTLCTLTPICEAEQVHMMVMLRRTIQCSFRDEEGVCMASTCSLDYVQRENVAAALRVFSEHGRAIKSMIAYHVKDPSPETN